MSAVLPYLEQKPSERSKKDIFDDVVVHEEDLLMGLGLVVPKDADGSTLDPLARPHTELTRLLWARQRVATALVGAKFKLDVDNGTLMVAVEPAVNRETVPWSFSASDLRRFSFFSTNSKMECPTWDLPSGIASLGGSCPGAVFAQSTVPEAMMQTINDSKSPDYGRLLENDSRSKDRLAYLIREVEQDKKHLPADERSPAVVNLQTTVCTRCYASGGKYGEAVVQFSEVARLALVNAMLRTPALEEQLITLIIRALEETKMHWVKGDVERHGIRPVRVHSSGDFYSQKYAEMWLKVADRLHNRALEAKLSGDREYKPIVLWAPTRTHVLKSWNDFWRSKRIPPNFVIRPSAYTVGDPAPYIKRDSPTGSKGTAVLFADDTEARLKGKLRGDGTKFDWQCGVYALGKGEKTCLLSTAPDGKTGCRACWKHPQLTVNYVVH